MLIPCRPGNPIEYMAAIGLAKITGLAIRWEHESRVQIDGVVDPCAVACAAATFVDLIYDDDIGESWREQVTLSMRSADRPRLDWLACLASDDGKDIVPSRFRFASGQQRWLRTMRQAAELVTEESVMRWRDANTWPREHRMTMCGWDCGSFTPAAHRWDASDTTAGSRGNPVGLYLACEGLQAWPCMQGQTAGWVGRCVRFPLWREFQSWDWIRSVTVTSAIHGRMDDEIVIGDDWETDQTIVSRTEYLRGIGVDAVFESHMNRLTQWRFELSAWRGV